MLLLIYADESGDSGYRVRDGSKTKAFGVSVVIVAGFRLARDTRSADRLPALGCAPASASVMREEIKAGHLIHGTGSCRNMSEKARMRLFKQSLRLQQKIGTLSTFSVIADKDAIEAGGSRLPDVRLRVWERTIERVERYTAGAGTEAMLFPDDGHHDFIKAILRRKRRFSRPASHYQPGRHLSRPAELILEDPVSRRSHESYYVQMADLNAYAAHRHVFPAPWCGAEYWDVLASCRVSAVNKLSGGPTGIVVAKS